MIGAGITLVTSYLGARYFIPQIFKKEDGKKINKKEIRKVRKRIKEFAKDHYLRLSHALEIKIIKIC